MKKYLYMGILLGTIALSGCTDDDADNKEVTAELLNTEQSIAINNEVNTTKTAEVETKIPYDMDIDRGSYSGTQFQTSYKLSSANGKNVNFYVNNTGNVAVKITINGSYAKTIQPGKDDYITAPVDIVASNYTFKAVPTPNGGKISIDYRIVQRD